jgi:hypothetical protein
MIVIRHELMGGLARAQALVQFHGGGTPAMARLDWERENRLARWRTWLSSLPTGWVDDELQSDTNDREYALWAERQVRRSVRRVREEAQGKSAPSQGLDGDLNDAEAALDRQDIKAARKAAERALNAAARAPIVSLPAETRQRIRLAVEGVQLLTDVPLNESHE